MPRHGLDSPVPLERAPLLHPAGHLVGIIHTQTSIHSVHSSTPLPLQDVRYFFILLAILYGGFAIAFNMQLGGEIDELSSTSQSTGLYLFSVMVGDFSSNFVLAVLQDEGQW